MSINLVLKERLHHHNPLEKFKDANYASKLAITGGLVHSTMQAKPNIRVPISPTSFATDLIERRPHLGSILDLIKDLPHLVPQVQIWPHLVYQQPTLSSIA
ncbi:hypothetical protein QQ045_009520 [Rhodiola kirilowii]